jgi:hypothetical protein
VFDGTKRERTRIGQHWQRSTLLMKVFFLESHAQWFIGSRCMPVPNALVSETGGKKWPDR